MKKVNETLGFFALQRSEADVLQRGDGPESGAKK